MNKIFLILTFCFICSNVFAANYDNCYGVFVGKNGKKYCIVHKPMNWFSAVAYCKKHGFEIASVNTYCDASKDPADRFKAAWSADGCPNMLGSNSGLPNNKHWLVTPASADGKMYARWGLDKVSDNDVALSETGNSIFGVVCDTGECAAGTWNEERGVCDDGFCVYTYTAGSVGSTDANCSYTFSPGSTGDLQANCSYTYSETDSSFSFSSSQPRGGCSSGQYCALQWSDADCKTGASRTSTTLYGICSPKDDYYVMCITNPAAASVSSSQPRGGCPADQYCSLNWANEACTTGAGNANEVTTIYGICTPKDDYYIMCLRDSTPASVTKRKGCASDQYCLLTYRNNTSCTTLAANSDDMEELYGICLPYSDATAVCPIQ